MAGGLIHLLVASTSIDRKQQASSLGPFRFASRKSIALFHQRK
jgi:hypothetical protein